MNKPVGTGNFILLALAVSGMVAVSGCTGGTDASGKETADIIIMEFETDKGVYGSHEEMEISAVIASPRNVGNVSVRLTGIKPYSYAYIDDSRTTDLDAGENKLTFFARTPYCTSGCGGVYPGPYSISLELFIGESLVSSSNKTIELVGD